MVLNIAHNDHIVHEYRITIIFVIFIKMSHVSCRSVQCPICLYLTNSLTLAWDLRFFFCICFCVLTLIKIELDHIRLFNRTTSISL